MTEAGAFAGRFHPLLVHFPIALLLLAGALELIGSWRRRRVPDKPSPSAAVTPLLVVGATTAVLAATAGYLLGTHGGYAGATYDRHFVAGLLVATVAMLTAIASWARDRWPGRFRVSVARVLMLAMLVVLTAAGHLGATLTHGEGYLTDHAPAPLRALLARVGLRDRPVRHQGPADQARIFEAVVQPILAANCVACHGPDKVQGGLRLDTPELIKKGGDNGPVLVAGRSPASEMVRRIWLPLGHDDAMPPRAHRPLSPADATILRWWIDTGARFEGTLADLDIPPDVLPALEATLGPIARGGPTLPPVSLTAPAPAALAALRAEGIGVDAVAAGSPFIQVHWTGRGDAKDDERVARLGSVAAHVLWLDLSGTGITDAAFVAIAKLPNLTRLNVSRTATSDAGLHKLTGLAHLEYLNLYGTAVSDAGMAHLASLGKLRRVYVWQTAVTPDGAQRLRTALPRLEAVLGAIETVNNAAPPDVPSR